MKNEDFNPLVSIVIPVYNGENYVSEAIDSALAQTYKNIEIIVVNDGSSDNTDKICKSYGNKIRYFSKINGGTSTALNFGIKKMEGEYFSWLSHDDMYYHDKIKREIEELSKLNNKDTIMMTDLDGIDENYNKIYETHYINHLKDYPPRKKSFIDPIIYNQTHGCTLLISKKCFQKVGLFDETSLVAQDFEFFYRAFLVFPHKLIPEILVTARDSSNRQGRRSKNKGSEEYSDLFIKIINNLTDDDYQLLASDKAKFYEDMIEFFTAAGYTKALNYVKSLTYNVLQVSSYDLIGNKFNGFDLHKNLRKKSIISNDLVWHKDSNDKSTYTFNFFMENGTKEFIKSRYFSNTDLIHFHLIHNIIDINYLPLITRLKPTVITFHDPYFLGGHCVHHFECNKWQSICYDCKHLEDLFPINYDYSSLNYFQKKIAIENSNISVIVSSDWMEKQVKESDTWKNKKIYKVPFGIDTDKFLPSENCSLRKEFGIPKDDIVLMFRSDSGKFKGIDIIKKSLNLLKERKDLSIITVGEKGLFDDYKKYFNFLEYEWIKDDDFLIKLYQMCDIFLMPSRQETFGMMAIEAMSCGKFVLSLDCVGSALKDVTVSPKYGLSVTEKDYPKVLKGLLNRKALSDKGNKCRLLVEKKYSLENYINNIITVYNEIKSNFNLDEQAIIVNEQLKKYRIEERSNILYIHKINFARKLFRKTPLKFRRKIKKEILTNNTKFYKTIRKKIIFDE